MSESWSTAAIRLLLAAAVGGMFTVASQSATAMTESERRTVVGAAIGALGGALVSGGDLWVTAGGAVAGGTIGNITTPERKRPRPPRFYRDHGPHESWHPGYRPRHQY